MAWRRTKANVDLRRAGGGICVSLCWVRSSAVRDSIIFKRNKMKRSRCNALAMILATIPQTKWFLGRRDCPSSSGSVLIRRIQVTRTVVQKIAKVRDVQG